MRTLEQRHAHAVAQIAKNEAAMVKHGRLARHHSGRDEGKADKAERLQKRAKKLLQKWKKEALALEARIVRAKGIQARPMPVRPPQAPAMSRRERLELDRENERRQKQLAKAGIEWDPRTAQGKRHHHVASIGSNLRVSIQHFDHCFKNRSERTSSRTLAWSYFEEHCARFHAALYPNQRYEPGVDVSTTPSVPEARLVAAQKDKAIQAWLGRDQYGLMVEVIYHQRSYTDIAESGMGYGDHKLVAGMFKRALDSYAAMCGISEDNTFARELSAALRRYQESA